MNFTGKNVLVVGASGAFGAEFAAQLKIAGAAVFGTARSANSSARLRADLEQRLLLDLESAASIAALAEYLSAAPEQLDGIVLAAGLVAFGTVSETPAEVVQRLMQVNALGQIHIVNKLLSKLMDSANAGREPFVVSISGVIAEAPMAGLAAYSASKSALHGYSIAAAKELRKVGVSWIDARPGHTESGLANRAIFGEAPNFGSGLTVQNVVSRILKAVARGERDLPSSEF